METPNLTLSSTPTIPMSSSLSLPLPFFCLPTTRPNRRISIHCGGPRSNRGPLVKGRILSIEAIHAIQALKRDQTLAPKILPRLIKSDLIATFKELLRQQRCDIALQVFSAIRSEYSPDLTLYADLVNGLTALGLTHEVDRLVCDIEEIDCDDKGLVKLVKALVEAQRRESTVRIYGLIKRCGQIDDYVADVLSKGLRRMGEDILANQIDQEVNKSFLTNLTKPVL